MTVFKTTAISWPIIIFRGERKFFVVTRIDNSWRDDAEERKEEEIRLISRRTLSAHSCEGEENMTRMSGSHRISDIEKAIRFSYRFPATFRKESRNHLTVNWNHPVVFLLHFMDFPLLVRLLRCLFFIPPPQRTAMALSLPFFLVIPSQGIIFLFSSSSVPLKSLPIPFPSLQLFSFCLQWKLSFSIVIFRFSFSLCFSCFFFSFPRSLFLSATSIVDRESLRYLCSDFFHELQIESWIPSSGNGNKRTDEWRARKNVEKGIVG